jgi:hypothetical protein
MGATPGADLRTQQRDAFRELISRLSVNSPANIFALMWGETHVPSIQERKLARDLVWAHPWQITCVEPPGA